MSRRSPDSNLDVLFGDGSAPEGEPRAGAALSLAAGLVFLVCLAATSGLLRAAAARLGPPETHQEVVDAKLSQVAALSSRPEVVFVGTSRTNRQVDPLEVAAGAAAAGRPLEAFNLGVDSATQLEALHLLERLAKQSPQRFGLVVVELDWVRHNPGNALTRRAYATHGLQGLRRALRFLCVSPAQDSMSWARVAKGHLVSFLGSATVLGVGPSWLLPPRPTGDLPRLKIPGPEDRGYLPMSEEERYRLGGFPDAAARARFQAELDARRPCPEALPPDPGEREFVAALLGAARAAGQRVAFLIPPPVRGDWVWGRRMRGAAAEHPEVPVLSYGRDCGPDEPFWQARHFFNSTHLDADGAAMFSRALGAALVPLLGPASEGG